jgi:glucose-6-phosphate isomerase, archaeal
MHFAEPAQVFIEPRSGATIGSTRRYQKFIRDLKDLYLDAEAYQTLAASHGDELAYEVYEYRPNENTGDLIFGTSVLKPGKVGREFYLTRGHIHAKSDRPETYYCQAGSGVMLLETPTGETRAVPMNPQTIVYVPPYWIHRSVNTGHELLVTIFCYPADAGQDYEIIGRAGGMKTLIVEAEGNGWKEIPNPRYRGRSAEEIARWLPPETAPV